MPAKPRQTLPQPGDTISGRYRLLRRIGEGGMAVVFEALHIRLQQRLAIKVLRPDVPDLEEQLVRFEREARTTAELRGVNIAKVVDVDKLANGLPYMVLEFLEGKDLDVAIRESGPLPVEAAVDYAMQAASAIGEAHGGGIVHRDLKPSNLFVCELDGEPDRRLIKLLDFGISRRLGDADKRLTQAGASLGTTHYMSPEQLRADENLDQRSDIWSLGVILYEMLTGKMPFDGKPTQIVIAIAMEQPRRIRALRADVPEGLELVIMRALEKSPSRRYPTMRDFMAALAPFGYRESTIDVLARRPRPRGRIGELLVNEGLITQEQLVWALAEQARTKRVLGQLLVEHGIVSRADLMAAIAKQQHMSYGGTLPPKGVGAPAAGADAARGPTDAATAGNRSRGIFASRAAIACITAASALLVFATVAIATRVAHADRGVEQGRTAPPAAVAR